MIGAAPRLLVALALAACAPRAEPPVHASALLDPPFTLAATPRGSGLDVRITTSRPLAGAIRIALEDGAGGVLERDLPARAISLALPAARPPWRLTATWQDPRGRMGATAVVGSEPAIDPRPAFGPIAPLRVGALRIDQAIQVPSGGRR